MKCSFELLPLPAAASSKFVPTVAHAPAALCPEVAPAPPEVVEAPLPDWTGLRDAALALENAVTELREAQRDEQRRWLWGALDVAVALAKRVLQRELSIDPDALHPLLERAVDLLGDAEPMEIALAPAAIASLEEAATGDLWSLSQRDDIRLVADPMLGVGEASVRSAASHVDVRMDALLSMLRDELVPEWEAELS